jgi:hypothetical protein
MNQKQSGEKVMKTYGSSQLPAADVLAFVSVNRLLSMLLRLVEGRGTSVKPIRALPFPTIQNAYGVPDECSPIHSVCPVARWLR